MAIQVKPTLFLGLGGTGKLVLNHIRSFLMDAIGEKGQLPGCFSFHAADIDTKPEIIEGKDVVLSTENDLFEMRIPPFNKIDNKVAEFPADAFEAVSQWWPKDLGKRLTERFSTNDDPDQAFQFRIIGRVAFWLNVFTNMGLRDRLSQALDNVRSDIMLERMRKDFPNLRPTTDQGTDIYVVSSIAGGTGCGMVIDTLAILRNLLREKTIESKTTTSTFLLLPEIFAKDIGEGEMDSPKCNTYAALKELDHLISSPEQYIEKYPGRLDVNIAGRLSTYFYLVDKQSESGRVFDDKKEIGNRIAKYIFHMTTGLSRHVNQAKGRISKVTGTMPLVRGGDTKISCAYSGFGFFELYYPRDVYLEYAKWFASQILYSRIDSEGDYDKNLVIDFLGDNSDGELATWRKQLIPTIPEPPKDFLNVVTTDYKNTPRKDTLPTIKQNYTDEKNRIVKYFKTQGQNLTNKKRLEERFNDYVLPELQRAIKDPANGLFHAEKLCQELGNKINILGEEYKASADEYRKRLLKKNPADLVKFKGISGNGPFAFMVTWRRREPFIRDLLKEAHGDIENLIKASRCELLAEICEILYNNIVSKWKEKITALRDKVNHELIKSKNKAQKLRDILQNADASWVGCDEEDRREIKNKVIESAESLVAILRQEISEKLTLPPDEFVAKLCDDVISLTHIERENILTQLEKSERDVRQHLGSIGREQAAPLWSYTGDMDTDLKSYLLTGFTKNHIMKYTGGRDIDGMERIVTQDFIGDCVLRFVTLRDGVSANNIAGVEGAYQAYKRNDGTVKIKNSSISLPATILRGAGEWPELIYEPKKPMDVPSYIRVSKMLGLLQKDKKGNYYTLLLKDGEQRYNGLVNVKKALAENAMLSDALQNMVVTKILEKFAADAESYLTWAAKNKVPEEITKEIKNRLKLS